jgi:hypothetical protein
MILKAASLGLAAACLMTISAAPVVHAQYAGPTVVTNGPQTDPGDVSPSWSSRQNVIESQRYDRLLETSPAFRQARIRKECGPVTDPDLHAQCISSFDQYEPMSAAAAPSTSVTSSMPSRHRTHYVGSSTAPRHYQSHYGQ